MTSKDVVREARKLVGVPYHHQGRGPGAIDCIGLLTAVAQALGYPFKDSRAYSREPDGITLLEQMQAHLDPVPVEQMRPADVLLFYFLRRKAYPQHVGVLTQTSPPQFVHTHAGLVGVVEVTLDPCWERRVHSVFRFRGVQ